MNRIKRYTLHTLVVTVVVAISVLCIGGCGQSESKVSFGYQPFGSNLPFFVAKEKGFFEDEGISVKPVEIISANDAANAIINEDIVGNATIPLDVILNIEEERPGSMKVFMVKASVSDKYWSGYLLVKEGSKIESIEDLKGKRVGGYPGSAQQTLIRLMMQEFMSKNDITTTELPPGVQLQALNSGQVDALLTFDQIAVTALQKGIGRVLVKNPLNKYVVDPLYGFAYVLSANFIDERPEDAKKIRSALYNAADYIKDNEDETRKIMANWTGVEQDVAMKVNLWSQVKAHNIDVSAMQDLANIYYRNDVVSDSTDVSRLIWDIGDNN